jgi:hypothetical protein
MEDEFMYLALRKPQVALLRQVRERLRSLEQTPRLARSRRSVRWVAFAASLALVVSLATVPSMRAGAQAFLDLFRVVNFVAVPVRKDRIDSLARPVGLDLPRMLSEQIKVLKAPSAPQSVASPEEAGALAGMRVLVPTYTPYNLPAPPNLKIVVTGSQALTVTASSQKLQQVLDAFGLDDLPVPANLDGKTVTINVHPLVQIVYSGEHQRVALVESRQPDVSLPAGLDLARLAEIGLRVIGMSASEAYQFAQQIDWRTTFVVPVPADATNFRQVTVQGRPGLLISSSGTPNGPPGPQAQLLWSTPDEVYVLSGNVGPQELLGMAQSMQ